MGRRSLKEHSDPEILGFQESLPSPPPPVPGEHNLPNVVKFPPLPPQLWLQSAPEFLGPSLEGSREAAVTGERALNPVLAAGPHNLPEPFPGLLQGSDEFILAVARPSSGTRVTVRALYTHRTQLTFYRIFERLWRARSPSFSYPAWKIQISVIVGLEGMGTAKCRTLHQSPVRGAYNSAPASDEHVSPTPASKGLCHQIGDYDNLIQFQHISPEMASDPIGQGPCPASVSLLPTHPPSDATSSPGCHLCF